MAWRVSERARSLRSIGKSGYARSGGGGGGGGGGGVGGGKARGGRGEFSLFLFVVCVPSVGVLHFRIGRPDPTVAVWRWPSSRGADC